MTKVVYDPKIRSLYIHISDEEVIADETIEDNLTLGWSGNGTLVDVCILDIDPINVELLHA